MSTQKLTELIASLRRALSQAEALLPTLSAAAPELLCNIMDAAAQCTGVQASDLRTSSRVASISLARNLSMWAMRIAVDLPLADIARIHGCRSHGSVCVAARRITGTQCPTEQRYRETLRALITAYQATQSA
jgi:chromosomal replication initiation ATPase DnaA